MNKRQARYPSNTLFPYDEDQDISLNMAEEKKIRFNISGVYCETLESTLKFPRGQVTKLMDRKFLKSHWDDENEEYFFDRDPKIFKSVLNYLRYGSLHLPHMCSPQITKALKYWGLPLVEIEPCCWQDYTMGIQSIENLRKLERDRKPAYLNPKWVHEDVRTTRLQRIRARVWSFVSDPSSSKFSKMYIILSFTMVMVSVVVFCLDSVDYEENSPFRTALNIIDNTVFYFFALEFLAASMSCPHGCAFFKSTLVKMDILALLPDVVEKIIIPILLSVLDLAVTEKINESNQWLSLLHLMRLCRVIRVLRRMPGMWVMLYTLQSSFQELAVILGLLCISTLFFASVLYYLGEDEALPSIPENCWYCFITLTTVGYGDVVPKEVPSKVIGAACAITGSLMLSLTIPTLISNFFSMYHNIAYIVAKEKEFLLQHKDFQSGAGFKVY